jgi:hypothetical protein
MKAVISIKPGQRGRVFAGKIGLPAPMLDFTE